ncbi:MAG: TIGR00730 family Rossman fold protein [Alphaproteobacteria bacterium]|nr:TIGR00730 family Rossman fold protein [Alphaproteobacteria bacterium]
MSDVHSVAVFCGSSMGSDPAHAAAAAGFGTALAHAGMRLVYGGGRVGLMGVIADTAIAAGGTVIGVIPEFLRAREVAHHGISETIVTDSMHTRKRRMFELADAFVALPGGLGTFDETFEILTWRQLKLHDKPILLCNINGAFAPLIAIIEAAIAGGFARSEARGLFEVTPTVAATIERLRHLATVRGGASALL